jgi:lipopolysaccharide transport protein LptA
MKIAKTHKIAACLLRFAAILALASTGSPSRADFTDDLTPAKGTHSGSDTGSTSKPTPKDKKNGTNPDQSGRTGNTSESSGKAANPSASKPSTPTEQGGDGSLMTDDLTKHDSNAPVNVSGKVMKGLRTAGRLDLEGDVVITQADARLLSDKATVFSEPVTNRTKKAIARGNVKFSKQSTPQSPALKAEADEMEYLVAERQVFMTGKPKVWRGNELIQGKEIVLELDSGTVTVKEARGILEPNNVPKKK